MKFNLISTRMARSVLDRISRQLRNLLLSDNRIAALLFLYTLILFMASPVPQVTDSGYSMLVSQSLIDYGSFKLDNYAIPRTELADRVYGNYLSINNIYQIEVVNDHLYYYFPPGTSVLSVPYVFLMNRFDLSAANEDGTYSPKGEQDIETSLAALLMAALTSIFFYTARLVLPKSWSVIIALAGAFGSQVWSTASRGMWSETWGLLLLGVALWMLLRADTGKGKLRPVLLASLLAWMYFVRPTNSITIFAVSVYVLLFYRRKFLSLAITGLAWMMGFILYSWHNFGRLLPSYYEASRLSFDNFWLALAGNTVSPSRGLLIYVPWILFIAYLLIRYWRYVPHRRLVILSLPVTVAHLLVVSSFGHWWGGYSFGARFMTSMVPWFVLQAVLAVRAWLSRREKKREVSSTLAWRAQAGAGALLLLLSFFINGRGAMSRKTWEWNVRRFNVDSHPEKVWDWHEPQFLAGLVRPEPPKTFPIVSNTNIAFGKPEADGYVWYGWGGGEGKFRWSDGREAALLFGLEHTNDMLLRMKMNAFLVPGQRDS
ncbi:MAG TPA: hypothetical protein VK619_07940, partial [Pyrinomonadaceae bacterium]|nr:hypothetical protein [Pyrinomonadaceae bacterium]